MKLLGISRRSERDEANQTILVHAQPKSKCSIYSGLDEQMRHIGQLSQIRLKRFR